VARARSGGGPTFLEFGTYRYYGHHTFELRARLRYRDPDEVERWRARDPLLLQAGRVAAEARSRVDAEVEEAMAEAVRFALASPKPEPAAALDYRYASAVPVRPGVAEEGRVRA
jgi:pyruvate dehydrogenase E1 component alpha subunit